MRSTITLWRACLVAAVGLAATRPAAAQGNFLDNLDAQTGAWQKADGWTNGAPFNNGWRADHVNFSGGLMTLTLDNASCPSGCSNMPYASGEYRTAATYSYGRIEARFKAAKGSGTIAASLFTYTGSPWDEIDIEILGKNTTQMQTNYFTNGVGGKEVLINLGFDAAAGFHTYAFEWTSSAIRWYVDGVLVHTENGSKGAIPTHPGQIMVNLWPGIGVDGWLGPFSYTGALNAQYDWIRFTAAGSATPTATRTATATATATRTASATATRTATATSRPPATATATTGGRATATATTGGRATATRTATAGATATRTATATATPTTGGGACAGIPAFQSCTAYAPGAQVTYNGSRYHAIAPISANRDCPPNSPYNPSNDNWWVNDGGC